MLCPYCSEEIKDGAKKCRFCGEFLDEELKEQKKSDKNSVGNVVNIQNTTDYTGCHIIKRGLFEGTPNIECPKCGYKGKANYQRGSYSGCLLIILLCLGIIPGILYYAFANGGKYVCPQCGVDHLRKIGKSTISLGAILSLIAIFIIIVALASSGGNSTTPRQSNTTVIDKTPAIRNVVQERVNYVVENFGPNGVDPYQNIIDVYCNDDCANGNISLSFSKKPTDPDIENFVDFIARGNAMNVSKVMQQAGDKSNASASIVVNGIVIYKCNANNGVVTTCEDLK